MWTLLQKIYGGGPLLVRDELDIYANDILESYLILEAEKKEERMRRKKEEQKEVKPPVLKKAPTMRESSRPRDSFNSVRAQS